MPTAGRNGGKLRGVSGRARPETAAGGWPRLSPGAAGRRRQPRLSAGRWKMAGQRILGIVLAGGAGKRLAPLTADRAKPAVPFGGLYRLVDFALSNLVNAGCRRICVLTQYKSHSLDRQAVVKNAILDKNVVVPEGATVGVDKEHERARGFVVSSGGITVVGKGQVVAP